MTTLIEAKVSISNIICSGSTPDNTSLLLFCPPPPLVLGMFCKIFAVFGKECSCPFHLFACFSSVKQHYFGDIESILAWKQFFFLGIKSFYQQQIMVITNLKKEYTSTFESPAHAKPCKMLAKFSSNNSCHSCIRYVLCVIILFLMWANISDRVLGKPMVGDQLTLTLQDFGIWLWSRYVPVTSTSGGGLGFFLGGYVPPGTPNWHPVLEKISPKIDAPF